MSVRQWFQDLKEGINEALPGLSNVAPEIGAELKRLGVQGQMEAASALFAGHSFVPYGPGQYKHDPKSQDVEPVKEWQKEPSQEMER